MCLKNSFHYEYIKDINVVKNDARLREDNKATVITSGTSIMKKKTFKIYDLLRKVI